MSKETVSLCLCVIYFVLGCLGWIQTIRVGLARSHRQWIECIRIFRWTFQKRMLVLIGGSATGTSVCVC